jgi:hypothetical protein
MKITKSIILGKVAYTAKTRRNRVQLDLELRWHEDGIERKKLDTDLQPIERYWELSICGGIWNATGSDYATCGQCIDTIAELYPKRAKVQEISAIWRRWHLNDMNAGTRVQNAAVAAHLALLGKYDQEAVQSFRRDHYNNCCELLKSLDLYEDRGYKYGHAWLTEPLPLAVSIRICELFGLSFDDESAKVLEAVASE